MKDTLFLLAPGFRDGDGAPYYCPYCTIFEGLLHLYPQLETQIDVRRVDFAKPRPEIVELLGAENQSCPVLVVNHPVVDPPENCRMKTVGNLHFFDEPEEIGNYLSQTYGIPRPH
jgi:hypothetical protein